METHARDQPQQQEKDMKHTVIAIPAHTLQVLGVMTGALTPLAPVLAVPQIRHAARAPLP